MKSLESLTYICTDASMLVDLDAELKRLLQTFRAGLPQEEQLVIRPSVISRALSTKRKYAWMKLNLSCSRLNQGVERKLIPRFVTGLEPKLIVTEGASRYSQIQD